MTTNIQILTPNGFKNFDGVKRYWHDKSLRFAFDDGSSLKTAFDHRFIVDSFEVFAKDVVVGQDIGKRVTSIEVISKGEYFYDPVNVDDGRIYSHDSTLVSHNTFHGTGNTLVDGDALLKLSAKDPVRFDKNIRIYDEPAPNKEYMMFVDVAKGRGQDYSTFNIIDITSRPFKQVCIFRNNNISPLLFPDVIYKYANMYNQAYVIIESNDQGAVVCNGLYYDLEYENVYVESLIKANSIGVTMNRKVKRIGCSNLKDLIEQNKLEINDAETIIELSTFVVRGSSYEAAAGNHDDLVMNLVLFGWFTTTGFFNELTDIDMKKMLYEEKVKAMEDDMVPVGVFDDGRNSHYEVEGGQVWETIETGII